jgi:hypothetical protein
VSKKAIEAKKPTGKGRRAAKDAWRKRRINDAFARARAAEAASKAALQAYCEKHGWRLAVFEGKTGAPRTGIVDAVAFRIARGRADQIDVRLIQLKGGRAGMPRNSSGISPACRRAGGPRHCVSSIASRTCASACALRDAKRALTRSSRSPWHSPADPLVSRTPGRNTAEPCRGSESASRSALLSRSRPSESC